VLPKVKLVIRPCCLIVKIRYLGDQVKLLTVNRRITFFQSQWNQVKAEIASTEIRNVKTYIGRCSVPNLASRSGPYSSRVEQGPLIDNSEAWRVMINEVDIPGPSAGTGRTNGSTAWRLWSWTGTGAVAARKDRDNKITDNDSIMSRERIIARL
jgi:hypothetical protein